MRAGRYAEAWAIEAQTIAARDPATRDDPALPYHLRWLWDGRAPDGRDVLVRSYHGLGDALQYARYLPLLARRARSVTLEVQPRLVPLLAQVPGLARIHPFDPARPLKPSEVDIELSELPCALRVAPDAIAVPYLAWPAAPVPPGTIGLCHAAGDWDAGRSLPADLFRPLCISHRCVTLVPGPSDLPVANPGGCPFAMEATAALVAGCDLVITVDTMIAHLAGAMGRPVWLLLKAEPDWRWVPGARTSAWYPSMRLYHQPGPGDWASVLAAVAADLADFPTKQEPCDHGQSRHALGARVLGRVARQADDPGDQARADRRARGAGERRARI